MNWKECTWKRSDDKDSGVIQASDLRQKRAMYLTKFSQQISAVDFSTDDVVATLG